MSHTFHTSEHTFQKMPKPLYVVTTVFNPRRFMSRIRLYKNFAKWVVDSGCQLVTAEIAYGERPFEVTQTGNPFHLQLRTNADLWHKERSLNLAIQHLTQRIDPNWGYVAYLDCDVKIMRDDWAEETVHLLQHYAILQMFGEIQTLDPHHHTQYGGRSIARNFAETGNIRSGQNGSGGGFNGWPGLGWGYRRKEFDEIGGLLDTCVTGSGDTYMAGCYLGIPGLGIPRGSSPGLVRSVTEHYRRCERYIRKNVSFLPSLLVHYWHGKAKDRGYIKRESAVAQHQFDPYTDLIVESNGLFRWTEEKFDLQREIRSSMEGRNEDSSDV